MELRSAAFAAALLLSPCDALFTRLVPGMSIGHALIVQNKGGGHGEIGYHLAKKLRSKDLDVTLLQDSKDPSKGGPDALPFTKYEEDLPDVNIVYADLSKYGPNYDTKTFSHAIDSVEWEDELQGKILKGDNLPYITHIFDNRGKEVEDLVLPAYFAWMTDNLYNDVTQQEYNQSFQLYTYISSAGMYNDTGYLREDSPIKWPPTPQRKCEMALAQVLPKKWCSFRPQYIYGPWTNKREYLDWFFNRVNHGLPLPIPGNGEQPVSLTHVADVVDLVSSVVGKEDVAANNYFNCGVGNCVTYNEVAQAVGKALGKPAEIRKIPAGSKTSFPFRPNAEGFANRVSKAAFALDWKGGNRSVIQDIKGFYVNNWAALDLHNADPPDTSNDGLELESEEEKMTI